MGYLVPITIFITLFSQISTFIINPGIIYSDNKDEDKIYCSECKFNYPKSNKKMAHCFTCGVCICNMDHHCGVIGKCVGKYNIILFLLFVLSSFGFIFCLSTILLNLLNLANNN